jgi:hypothetical protein
MLVEVQVKKLDKWADSQNGDVQVEDTGVNIYKYIYE